MLFDVAYMFLSVTAVRHTFILALAVTVEQ